MRYPQSVPRSALVEVAETLSLSAISATQRESAAYAAWKLADPFSEPSYKLALDQAGRGRLLVWDLFLEALEDLLTAGLANFAENLLDSTKRRCNLAESLATNHLPGKDSDREANPLSRAPSRAAEGPAHLPGLPAADRAEPPRRPLELHLAAARRHHQEGEGR
jgi:hypothetical protein